MGLLVLALHRQPTVVGKPFEGREQQYRNHQIAPDLVAGAHLETASLTRLGRAEFERGDRRNPALLRVREVRREAQRGRGAAVRCQLVEASVEAEVGRLALFDGDSRARTVRLGEPGELNVTGHWNLPDITGAE